MEKVITRRRVLQGAGCAIAAAAFPSMRLIGGQSASPISAIMSKLSGYMAEASGRALPGDVVENQRQSNRRGVEAFGASDPGDCSKRNGEA